MSSDFATILNGKNADADTLQQALRYYVAEKTSDATARQMRLELASALGGDEQLEAALEEFKRAPRSVEEVSLLVLSSAWEDPAQAPIVERSVDAAKEKLPVVEAGLLTLIAMYGMYLLATGGVAEHEKVTVLRDDGTFETKEKVKYFSAVGPLSTVFNLFRKRPAADGES